MEEHMILIPIGEYKSLLEKEAAINVFENFCRNQGDFIEKNMCNVLFGFGTRDIEVIGSGENAQID